MIIGLAGGTGSGKSMIVQSLVARVGGCVIDLDSYYCDRSALSREERSRINYDEPTAIDVALLVALTDLPQAAVEDALATLERARLVTFEGSRYTIAAPLIAQVVLAEWLLPGERHMLRQHAINALTPRSDVPSRLLRVQL